MNTQGNVEGLIYTLVNVTEQKKAERALLENEARYRNIVENLHQAYYEANSRSVFTYCNPELIIISGYSKQELMKTSSLRLVAQEHRTRVANAYTQWKKEKQTEMSIEFLVQKKNGEQFWVEQTSHYEFDEHGNFVKAANIVKNIHERKLAEDALRKSEERYRQLFENLPIGIYRTTPDGRILAANPALIRMLGYASFDEYVNRNLEQDPDSLYSRNTFKEQLEREGHINGLEAEWYKADKTRMFVRENVQVIRDEKGNAVYYDGTVEDITERKNNEQIIRDVQRRESIGVLAGGIAHDFNNLLNAMMGNISLAQVRVPSDHPAAINISRALSAMDRAATLTKQLLAYSGKGKFQIREIDVVALVQEHANLFEVSLPKNITLSLSLPPDPIFIKGDQGQIEQVVMNLIINGGDAIGKKQGAVSVDVSSVTMVKNQLAEYGKLTNTILKEGPYALIEVADNGSGISRETLSKIFDPFFTTKETGRGLGLSAVLGILHGHEGGITIESKEGVGTTFRVVLPMVQAATPPASLNKGMDLPLAKDKKIFIIDDEQYIVDMANDILESVNYQRLSTTDPVNGVQLFKEHWRTIDAVILDFSMPKLNGREVFVELQKINPAVKVIISSGYTEEEIIDLMGNFKPTAFIQKPYTAKALLHIVGKVLGIK
jgi:PAS domain S-box-containing protein